MNFSVALYSAQSVSQIKKESLLFDFVNAARSK